MMEGRPIKFYILEQLCQRDMWTDEIVQSVLSNYHLEGSYSRDMTNYDIIELVSAGLVHEGESRIDEDGHYKQGHLLTHYSITHLGREYYDDLAHKVQEHGEHHHFHHRG